MEDPSTPERSPIRFRRKPVPEEKTAESWQRIASKIAAGKRPAAVTRRMMFRLLAAAVILPLVIYGGRQFYCYLYELNTKTYHTAYGEIKQIVLPDSSIVFLNANSTLRVPAGWDGEKDRTVWLEGEAYFEITKQPGATNAPFIVRTEEIDVAVLGTKFNVNMLADKTTVSLKEGKVQLTAKAPLEEGRKVFVMKPGDEVLVEKNRARLKESVNTDLIADWRNHRYHFDNTTIHDISSLIASKFGLTVIIEDEELKHRRISGDLYAEDIAQLSRALSVTMNIRIEQKDQQLFFSLKE